MLTLIGSALTCCLLSKDLSLRWETEKRRHSLKCASISAQLVNCGGSCSTVTKREIVKWWECYCSHHDSLLHSAWGASQDRERAYNLLCFSPHGTLLWIAQHLHKWCPKDFSTEAILILANRICDLKDLSTLGLPLLLYLIAKMWWAVHIFFLNSSQQD